MDITSIQNIFGGMAIVGAGLLLWAFILRWFSGKKKG